MYTIALIAANFYEEYTEALIAGAKQAVENLGHQTQLILVPGALEIPAAIKFAARSGKFDGYVALGCVIRGETTHYETVCNESARAIMELTVQDGLCIGNGILTVENDEQAWVRADTQQKNKGGDAAKAALALLAIKERYRG